ncbi:MAG: response regulator receiver [Gemmatimonadetes bacterium]|jgi:two-component system LytT family response regulator|nr:response regulator receiver [Gemmatimonadota bacterium]
MADSLNVGNAPLRVLVVDDEPLNRLRLEDLLRRETGVAEILSASDGYEAVTAIRAERPDLVFLDVQMPGKTGLDVVREVGADAMPATIFVTAYDQYAVEAFAVAAVDYLVKPFDDERFEEAFRRARKTLAANDMGRLREQLLSILQPGANAERDGTSATSAAPGSPYLERLAVEIRGTVKPVLVQEIDYITSDGPYAELHVAGRRHVIRETMQTLEERLDPSKFMRVHRSVIVRLELIESLERGAGGDGELRLRGGARLRVSRTRREALERWLGLAR